MKVIINGLMFDPKHDTIVIVFKNEDERKFVSDVIMARHVEKGPSLFSLFKSGLDRFTRTSVIEKAKELSGYFKHKEDG